MSGPLVVPVIQTMQRVWAIVEIAQLRSSDVPLFPDEEPAESAGTQVAKFTIRDNLRHRRDIERAYLAGLRTAHREILIATAYFFPGVRFRRALITAAARLAARNEPANSQLLRPSAIGRIWFST